MLLDVRQLMAYYATPRGLVVQRAIRDALQTQLPDMKQQRVLGYGFTQPYLQALAPEAERIVAFMPAPMGCISWPESSSVTVLGDEAQLPFPEAFFDRILLLHGLESAENPRRLIRHLWRILAPQGRIILVVPNRMSFWALSERSPFGCGRPFRKAELNHLLQHNLFTPLSWSSALYFPPWCKATALAGLWEKWAAKICRGLGGVHIVVAEKNLYASPPVCVARVYPAYAPKADIVSMRSQAPQKPRS